MKNVISRRNLLAAAAAVPLTTLGQPASGSTASPQGAEGTANAATSDHIVDIHTHFDPRNPNYLDDFLRMSDRLNVTACMLTPFEHRKAVATAAKQHPRQILPFGFVDLDAPDVAKQVEELHDMGYRGLGELEFVKKPYNDLSYFPVYDLANRYGWVVLFHTGIVLRAKFNEPEDVASGRMRPIHLEEIARRFPKITVLGAHCGNPEYEWAAEITRWNPNVFFDLSGSSLVKMRSRLAHFRDIFWWSGAEQDSSTPNNDPSAFIKLVFGSDTPPAGVEGVLAQYRAMFEACDVPATTRKMILGGTMAQILGIST